MIHFHPLLRLLDFVISSFNSFQIYIRFYGANCGVATNSQFDQSLNAWLAFAKRILERDGSAPLIFIGVPAMERATPIEGCYQTTRDLKELFSVSRTFLIILCFSQQCLKFEIPFLIFRSVNDLTHNVSIYGMGYIFISIVR